MPRHYCTYFDAGYLVSGLTLYHSLKNESSSPFLLWVLCLDQTAKDALDERANQNIRTISLRDLEESDPELLSIKGTRSLVEYYFTCTPCLPWYILKTHEEVKDITYLDSDIFFFLTLKRFIGLLVSIP